METWSTEQCAGFQAMLLGTSRRGHSEACRESMQKAIGDGVLHMLPVEVWAIRPDLCGAHVREVSVRRRRIIRCSRRRWSSTRAHHKVFKAMFLRLRARLL